MTHGALVLPLLQCQTAPHPMQCPRHGPPVALAVVNSRLHCPRCLLPMPPDVAGGAAQDPNPTSGVGGTVQDWSSRAAWQGQVSDCTACQGQSWASVVTEAGALDRLGQLLLAMDQACRQRHGE